MSSSEQSMPARDGVAAQERMNAYWTRRAEEYDAAQRRTARAEADHRVWSRVWGRALGPEPREILDLGCGSGHASFVLAGLGHRVLGADLAESMIGLARERAEVGDWPGGDAHPAPQFVRGDAVDPAASPEVAGRCFDAVVSRYLMWTLREPETAVRRWTELLPPGGVVAVVDAPWFSHGLASCDQEGFLQSYDSEVTAQLPLAETTSITPVVEVLRGAGLHEVEAVALSEVYDLDREYGVPPGHEVVQQYLVRGRV